MQARDIKMDSYTFSSHGRTLIEGADVSLKYGQRYGLLGDRGSAKVRHPDTHLAGSHIVCEGVPI